MGHILGFRQSCIRLQIGAAEVIQAQCLSSISPTLKLNSAWTMAGAYHVPIIVTVAPCMFHLHDVTGRLAQLVRASC